MTNADNITLPAGYRERLPRAWHAWAKDLPEIVATYLERWELEVAGEFPLSYSYVVPVERSDGSACVLKVQPTDIPEVEGAERELLGLHLAGEVAVRVVEEDARAGVLLLERAVPGTSLDEMAERDDDLATETLASVIAGYGRPVADPETSGLRPIVEFAEVFERFDRGPHGEVARRKLASVSDTRLSVLLGMDELGTGIPALRSCRYTAEEVMTQLALDKAPQYLLHGDLHHANVLSDEERGLLVIDPWGMYGDREADVAAALHNPPAVIARTDDLDALLRRRLSIYSDAIGLDMERLTAWCFAYNVIRALWTLEDRGEVAEDADDVRTATALRRMI
jgi:streptomycin 6-kinase